MVSKRLQVVLDDGEMAEIRRAARRQRATVSEWVRRVLRDAHRTEPRGDVVRKLEVVRQAAAHSYPTGDVDDMLAEIEQGYLTQRR